MRDTAKPLRRVGRRGERRSTWSRKAPLLPGGTTHELPWRRAPVRRRRHPYAWGRAALDLGAGGATLRGSSPPPGTAGAASEDMAARRKPARPVGHLHATHV